MNLSLIAQAQDNGAGAAAAGGVLSFMLVIWIVVILASIFWIWMLIDVLVSKREACEKILWFLVIFFLHFIGAVAYYFIVRSPKAGTSLA